MTSTVSPNGVLESLHEATRRLMTATTTQEICEIAVDTVREVLDERMAALWLFDADEEALKLVAMTDNASNTFGSQVAYHSGNSLSWKAFDAGEVRVYSNLASEADVYNADTQLKSEIILPLGDHGVMNIGALSTDAFDESDIRAARILASNTQTALERAEREHALRVKNDRLEEFVGIVSHDLRNPLEIASANLKLAREDPTSETFDSIETALNRMDSLIDDLLTLAKEGDVVDERTAVDLETVAENAWAGVRTYDAELIVEENATIFCDPDRLQQVLENLFRNSIDHGGKDVTVRLGRLERIYTSTRTEGDDPLIGCYVADDGPGIPDDIRDDIFESGYSTENSSGFGLAIVKRIVQAHGWKIVVTESADGGARFEIKDDAQPLSPFTSF